MMKYSCEKCGLQGSKPKDVRNVGFEVLCYECFNTDELNMFNWRDDYSKTFGDCRIFWVQRERAWAVKHLPNSYIYFFNSLREAKENAATMNRCGGQIPTIITMR